MVVFTCGHCGESVQKPKVEKHYLTICRNRSPNLSCMDCFKDFLGKDYEGHIKCITEEERYSGKGFVSKEKKGEKKQNTWVEMLQSVLDEQPNAPRNVRRILETITKHNNTPRKKPKFINFVKNVCGAKTNLNDMEQAWDLISVKLTALSNANNRNQNQNNKAENSENDKKQNGIVKEKVNEPEENGTENTEETNLLEQNGVENQDGDQEQNGETEKSGKKKLSKKQKKEEKKHKKYEAELQSAAAPPPKEEVEETENKKGKKKKNKTESISNGDDDNQSEGKNGKNKKRKRQDTVNSVNGQQDAIENGTEQAVAAVATGKIQKKKIKTEEEEEAEESICLHDQNVAKIEELAVSSDKFNWHAVIISVLQKKGNEVPFKRLQKKVLGEYSEATGREVDDRIADKFIKKLRSAPNVRVDKNRVLLLD